MWNSIVMVTSVLNLFLQVLFKKFIWHFDVTRLISQQFTCRDLNPVAFLVPEAATRGVTQKQMLLKIHKIHRKTPVPETLAQVIFGEFCDIFKNIFFTEHLWTTDCFYNAFIHVIYFWLEHFRIITEIFIQLIHLFYITNAFIEAKFCFKIFSFFEIFKNIECYCIECRTTERDWKFLLIQMFNNRKCFLDVVEIYSITNLILLLLWDFFYLDRTLDLL